MCESNTLCDQPTAIMIRDNIFSDKYALLDPSSTVSYFLILIFSIRIDFHQSC